MNSWAETMKKTADVSEVFIIVELALQQRLTVVCTYPAES